MKLVLKAKLIFGFGLIFIALPVFVFAESFYIDADYDKEQRDKISASQQYKSDKAYFYIEDEWWEGLSGSQKAAYNTALQELAKEFDEEIKPQLTSIYGEEWSPGIDGDKRITVLFTQTEKRAGGYFRNSDEYRKLQVPDSNEREMVYLSTQVLDTSIPGAYLAHEFTHLITFNQKNRLQNIEEDVWLNELRAEYAPTLLGYDSPYEGSNLEKRIDYFITSPSDSLTEWKSEQRDYGVVNIFAQYLAEHYGLEILTDSLKSPFSGIASLNYALQLNGFQKDLSRIFAEFSTAVFINDCDLGEEYCFQDEPLKYLRLAPNLLYLPSTQQASMNLVYAIKQWSGHWYKIIGGGKGLIVKFESLSDDDFQVAYLVQRGGEAGEVNFLKLDEEHKGKIELPYFSQDNQALIIIPTITSQITGFSDDEPFWRFSLDIQAKESGQILDNLNSQTDNEGEDNNSANEMTVEELEKRIAEVLELINALKQQIAELKDQDLICQSFESNLYYGMRDNEQVRCLQQFLKNQGEAIYPEGIVSGNFLDLTKQAVIRFQEKYSQEILGPLGLEKGTGYVGPSTREKINQLLD